MVELIISEEDMVQPRMVWLRIEPAARLELGDRTINFK